MCVCVCISKGERKGVARKPGGKPREGGVPDTEAEISRKREALVMSNATVFH